MTPDETPVEAILKKLKARFAEADEEKVAPAQREKKTAVSVKAPRPADDEKMPPTVRNRRHWVAVCYDIPDDRRRTKVMKTLEGYGRRVQYSVFECELRPADLDKLKARLGALIQKEEDDIRFYDLCENCQGKVTTLGRAQMHRQAPYEIVPAKQGTGRQGNKGNTLSTCLLVFLSTGFPQFLNPIQPKEQDATGQVAIGAQVGDAAVFFDPMGGDGAFGEDVAAGGEVAHGE